MENMIKAPVVLGATAAGAAAVVLGTAGLLAFGPRAEAEPSVKPAAVQHISADSRQLDCSMFCDPAPADGHDTCVLLCEQPEWTPPDGRGCRLFCGIEEGGRK